MDTVSIIKDVVIGVGLGYSGWQAKRAKSNTKATSNGFAGRVTGALERIENKLDHHIQSHADNDIRRNS